MNIKYFKKTADGEIQLPTLKTYNDLHVNGYADIKELKVDGVSVINKHFSTGAINENLIFMATQYTADMSEEAFSGTFYEIPSFMESEQIPDGAKLIYVENNKIKFTNSYPPFSGLKYGMPSSVQANKDWFENISWLDETNYIKEYESFDTDEDFIANAINTPFDVVNNPVSIKVEYDGKSFFYPSLSSSSPVGGMIDEDKTLFAGFFNKTLTQDFLELTNNDIGFYISQETSGRGYGIHTDKPIKITIYSTNEGIKLEDFTYSTPAINIGDERKVATQEVQSFIDYRQNAINELLDLRSSENRKLITTNHFITIKYKLDSKQAEIHFTFPCRQSQAFTTFNDFRDYFKLNNYDNIMANGVIVRWRSYSSKFVRYSLAAIQNTNLLDLNFIAIDFVSTTNPTGTEPAIVTISANEILNNVEKPISEYSFTDTTDSIF